MKQNNKTWQEVVAKLETKYHPQYNNTNKYEHMEYCTFYSEAPKTWPEVAAYYQKIYPH